MRLLLPISIVVFIFASCKQETKVIKIPDDLAGKKKMLTEKKNALKKMESDILELEQAIDKQAPPKKAQSYDVYVHQVDKQDFESYVKLQGAIATDEFVSASSETGGRIVRLYVDESDYVKAGQRIARIDMSTMEKQLEELKTSYKLAKTVYDRQKRLWDQQIGSELQFLEAKNNKERLEKSMSTIENQLGKSSVRAPISGFVDRVVLKQGELAGPGVPIVQILNTSEVKVVADVPESYLPSLKRGTKIDISFPALEKELTRPISMLGRTIDPANRTFKIEMKTRNPDGMLKPNLLAEVTIPEKKIQDAVVLPINLIRQEVTGSKYVYVVQDESDKKKVNKVFVKTAESYENLTVIAEGLVGGEWIVESGGEPLSDGSFINILEREELDEQK